MNNQAIEHIIFVLTECRSQLMEKPDPMTMERIQEAITLCRHCIATRKERELEGSESRAGV